MCVQKWGHGLNCAACTYNVPKATLKRRIDGVNVKALEHKRSFGRSIDLHFSSSRSESHHTRSRKTLQKGTGNFTVACKYEIEEKEDSRYNCLDYISVQRSAAFKARFGQPEAQKKTRQKLWLVS